MKKIIAITAVAAALAACSPKAQNETAEAANAVATDVATTTAAGVNTVDAATDDAIADVSNAADVAGNRAATEADKLKRATGEAMTETGNDLKK